MELILKPTSRCNFACTFCSAGNLDILHFQHMTDKLKELLHKINPTNIILTGGDPLTVNPEFYDELLVEGDWRLSFTTNLKDFYLNPDKWLQLFKNPRVGVCTSFQYGEARRWDEDAVYDESLFRKVSEKFSQLVGYSLMFIAVISDDNERYVMKHLELAKSLQMKCKLNGMMPLGNSRHHYPQYKMIRHWLDIQKSELKDYLDASTMLFHGGCNLNTNRQCTSTIRALQFYNDGTYKLTSCEDDLVKDVHQDIPLAETTSQEHILDPIHPDCMFCELFNICNGCHQYRELNRNVHEHCQEMKKMKNEIMNSGWRLQ